MLPVVTPYSIHGFAMAVLTACLSLWAIPAHAQFQYTALTTDSAVMDVDTAQYELEVLARYVAEYPRMNPEEQQAWQKTVDSPYPGATAPVEFFHMDWILRMLRSEVFAQKNGYWTFAYHALVVSQQLIPDAPELPPIAQRILNRKLPSTVAYLPHETLIERCLSLLVHTESNEYMDFVRTTERTDFWRDKSDRATLEAPSSLLHGEEDHLLLTLRAKPVLVLATHRPEIALNWIEEIMARTNEAPGYLHLIEACLDLAKQRLHHAPDTRGDFEPDFAITIPRLSESPSTSRFTTYDFRPVLNTKHLETIKPDVAYLHKQESISEETQRLCEMLADENTYKKSDRIACCRTLSRENELPVELARWVTMNHVLLAGELGLANEVEQVALEWIERYPDDWDPLPPYWKQGRRNEINVNLYLRGYLAEIYSGMESIPHTWSIEDREAKFRALIKPLLDGKRNDNEETLLAHLYFMALQDMLHDAWATKTGPEHNTPQAQRAWALNVAAVRNALETEQLGHLDTMTKNLQETKAHPIIIDKRRRIVLPIRDLADTVKVHSEGIRARQSERGQS